MWLFKSLKYIKKNHLVKLVITFISIFLRIFFTIITPNNMYFNNFLIYEYSYEGADPDYYWCQDIQKVPIFQCIWVMFN